MIDFHEPTNAVPVLFRLVVKTIELQEEEGRGEEGGREAEEERGREERGGKEEGEQLV